MVVRDTKDRDVNDLVSIEVEPENIQIMKKEYTSNIYVDAWLDKNNNLVISDGIFPCDVTQLLKGSKLDEEGYIISADGKKYDLNDADVIAEIPIEAVEITDGYDQGEANGIVIDSVYKGDHYVVIVRTEEEEDYVLSTQYTYNVGDQVSVHVAPKDIKLTLKGDIKKYVQE